MLRRPPTAITLTSDDVAAYEQARQRRIWETNNSQLSATSSDNSKGKPDPNDELRPLPTEKARIVRTREERIMGSRS